MQGIDVQAAAAVISAICAVVAATIAVLVWLKARSGDLAAKIDNGDKATRKHVDKSISDIKAEQEQMSRRMADVEDGVARIEEAQKAHLTAKDLSLVHEKINRVAEAIAANAATTSAINEQLKTIQSYILRGKP